MDVQLLQGRRTRVREVTENPNATVTDLHCSSAAMENSPQGQQSVQHLASWDYTVWPESDQEEAATPRSDT